MDGPSERLPISAAPETAPEFSGKRTRRRRSRLLAFVRGLFGLIFAVGLVGAGAAALIGWNLYQRY
jgi:hypothetical protein